MMSLSRRHKVVNIGQNDINIGGNVVNIGHNAVTIGHNCLVIATERVRQGIKLALALKNSIHPILSSFTSASLSSTLLCMQTVYADFHPCLPPMNNNCYKWPIVQSRSIPYNKHTNVAIRLSMA